jgi:hypothetical protein
VSRLTGRLVGLEVEPVGVVGVIASKLSSHCLLDNLFMLVGAPVRADSGQSCLGKQTCHYELHLTSFVSRGWRKRSTATIGIVGCQWRDRWRQGNRESETMRESA